jgi:hypothetical protein
MTREQKAAAAIGSIIVISLLYMWAWSPLIGFILLFGGLGITVGLLRATHPRGRRRPGLANVGLVTPPRPLTEDEKRDHAAEEESRRIVNERRAIERAERQERTDALREQRRNEVDAAAAKRAAVREERSREEAERRRKIDEDRAAHVAREREAAERRARDEAGAAARDEAEAGRVAPPDTDDGILAASQTAELPTDPRTTVDEDRQRFHLLDRVRLRLSDYE